MTTDRFATLHRDHDARLRRQAARLLRGSGADVDDVMQEVWLRAYRSLPQGADAGAWLHVVTANCCADALRRMARHRTAPVELDALPGGAQPEEQVAGRDELRDVLDDLGELDARQRAAFVRHVVDGAPHEAVAAELAVSRQASRSLVLRARRNLERRRMARAGGLLSGWLPVLKAKTALLGVSGAVATGALFTLERHELVEPAASPETPAWKLPAGFAVARHALDVAPEGVGRSLRVELRCPAGYLLWQLAGARRDGAELRVARAERWLGAPSTRVRVIPSRAGRVDVWAYCRPRAVLEREFRRDPRLLRALRRNAS